MQRRPISCLLRTLPAMEKIKVFPKGLYDHKYFICYFFWHHFYFYRTVQNLLDISSLYVLIPTPWAPSGSVSASPLGAPEGCTCISSLP